MTASVEALLSLAGPPLSRLAPLTKETAESDVEIELIDMLAQTNGFYAFESALHVFPGESDDHMDLVRWNAPSLWRDSFDSMADDYTFFAEDVFGGQFALAIGGVYSFDPETADAVLIGDTLEEWAEHILEEYEVLTGYPLAHDWQVRFGPLQSGTRLIPKIPFVLGGEFELGNVFAGDAVQGMRMRGEVAVQIRDLPDGTKVQYRIVE
jgi:hypothetical protein